MPVNPLNIESFAQTLHASLRRKDVTEADILAVLNSLDLNEPTSSQDSVAPRLRVRRLRFRGTKTTHDGVHQPIDYDQRFADGVNVVLIERNTAGKSTILKTILFALSGDRTAYDSDVKKWIEQVWLTFAIENAEFTIALDSGDHVRGVMVLGYTESAVETLVAGGEFLFSATTQDELSSCLQTFFFQRLGLSELRWVATQQGGNISEARTSWRTYMQPLHFDADALDYLLCNPAHSFGNQQGLIFSAYLGLHFAQALNQLGVEGSTSKRESKLTEEEAERLRAQLAKDNVELAGHRQALTELDLAIRKRQKSLRDNTAATELVVSQQSILERYAELHTLDEQREHTGNALRRCRARKLRLEEAISMRLHLSGIDVTLCPNCEHDVTPEAIEREKTSHHCRLCGSKAEDADAAHVAQLEEECRANDEEIARHLQTQAQLAEQMDIAKAEISAMRDKSALHYRETIDAASLALPTDEENSRRETLFEMIGSLRASIRALERQLESTTTNSNSLELRAYVLKKVREAIVNEATTRNAERLGYLAKYIEEFARTIGTDSISDVTCSALGVVQLRKHGVPISFTGIRNPGERLRVKLSFFLALAELGREPCGARHPGLLLIDQPGTSEMVPEDFVHFADILRKLDAERSDRLQILCFTARSELRAATVDEKIYGPRNGDRAF